MEQHPIPQQISSYEFRLVGSMTLRQFFKLAGGVIIAFIFYASHLPFFLKWPGALASVGLGISLAFIPINERPLEVYIIAFLRSVFNPTIYLWQKQTNQIDLLETSFRAQEQEETEEEPPLPSKAPQLEEFLASLPSSQQPASASVAPPAPPPPSPTPTSTPTQTSPLIPSSHPNRNPPPEPLASSKAPPSAVQAEFGQIPLPEPPKTANIIVGMVTDAQGKIVEDAIVEIQDNQGNPVRALRTNRLGQFQTATPLANGDYLILTEKEGHQFDILKVKAEGKVIPPIRIRAKN